MTKAGPSLLKEAYGPAGHCESVLSSQLASPPTMSEACWPSSSADWDLGTADCFLELTMHLPTSFLHWHPAQVALEAGPQSPAL